MPRHLLLILLAVSCLCRSLSTAHAASYTFTTLDVPGTTRTLAFGINDVGQIVGNYQDASAVVCFLRPRVLHRPTTAQGGCDDTRV